LLFFEGALRKWILPGLATPLLIVRDPIAIWLIYFSWKSGFSRFNLYVFCMFLIGTIGIITALLFGHGNLFVAIYGARILLLHFPLMFIIGSIFNFNDIVRVGKIILYLSIPLVILTGLQFYSPQSAWVNRGIGGDIEGSGFSGALGYFRPSGIFSFTNGNSLFFSLLSCFIFYFWMNKEKKVNHLLLICSTIALLASIPISISRTLLYSIGLTFLFTLVAVSSKPKFLPKMVFSILIGVFLIFELSQFSVFEKPIEAFTSRFETASTIEGGVSNSLVDRYFGSMIDAITETGDLPFFGFGIGMGTNVGSKILTGERAFLVAEWEWLRVVGELGFVLGILMILIRFSFCLDIAVKSFNMLKFGNILPWLFLSNALISILQGQWAQPTVLGFSTLTGGLILAALNQNNEFKKKSDESKSQ
jgi:hypothetical protein